MSVDNHNAVLDAIKESLVGALPGRYVQRDLIDPMAAPQEQLLAGLICLVTKGGGDFANYRGREGDLGKMDVALVGYLQVAENASTADVERAELTLLGDLLRWISTVGVPGLDVIYPTSWQTSKQLEHPFGWLVLDLEVKP